MHPLIKIIVFLVLVAFIVLGKPIQLVLALLITIVLALQAQASNLLVALRMLKRLRWLFLSILLVYVFLSPGVASWFTQGVEAMDWGGLNHGLLRIASLVLIVVAVNILVLPIPREQLVAAIISLLRPLCLLGFPHERLALRIALVLEITPQVRNLYQQQRDAQQKQFGEQETFKLRLQGAGAVFVQTFSMALLKAHEASEENIELPLVGAPPWYQWLWPLLLTVVFTLVTRFV